MSASRALGGSSRAGRVLGPSLDKIIKNVAWRKNSQLVSSCKCAIDKLETIGDLSDPDHKSPLFGISSPDAEITLQPLILALDSGSLKVVEPALECSIRLFSLGLIRGEVNGMQGDGGPSTLTFHLFDVICKCGGLGDEAIELAVLRALLSAIRSTSLLIRGDCLLQIVRACYNVYLESSSGTNQICAKAVLAQIMVIVFSRVQEDKVDVSIRSISVYDLLEFNDKNLSEGNSIQIAQAFINEVLAASETDTAENLRAFSPNLENGDNDHHQSDEKFEAEHGERNISRALTGDSKIRVDGFLLFRNLCKLSMKFTAQEHSDDDILLKGKILSLELLRVVMDNASLIWRSNERFLGSLKQYLCLSLLKNSGLSVMTIFQLLCSILMSLLVKFRAGLKAEIGIFFPMLILRVLENVSQPSFLQKMTVLGILNKILQDPNIIIDIFVNYDCDVDAPNIFERTVNGLLKTSLGPAPTSPTTLSVPQDITFRIESVKCLSSIIKSMGIWMDQQLRMESFYSEKNDTVYSSMDANGSFSVGEGAFPDLEHHHESSSELSDASSFEQRRTFKVELQKGISLFNRKPSKGIDFLIKNKKIGSSSEEVASFLKRTSGLNKGMIGDYLGDRDEFPLKVMHAYVDSFDLEAMDFGEAIRFFLKGFRLPGEAQKIDRLMEKFAERYCKCNPNSFTRADTAYVLAYSVIMLNTDAHNDTVKEKMTKADFIRNNRGIDDGKDLPEEYLGGLYDKITRNEIKMSVEGSGAQGRQVNGLNRLLGLDGILNLVFWKQSEEKPMGANVALISHIQEQFKSKAGNSESTYYAITDVAILRFMVEVYWGPMLAAFSLTLDQSDDKEAISQCLAGFKYAVHVTGVMDMRTQRDAFVTTVAKFTYLHCAADMKQKNIDAMKAMISIAIEEGNKLNEAWEHVLTCLSRFEHLQLLGDGVLPDASFFANNRDAQDKSPRILTAPLNKKEALQSPAVMAVVRGGSYDSHHTVASALVTSEQINNFILNLNLLDQIGSFELNHIFAHSQRLNSDAIVSFVKSLCKVAMSELQSPTDPRVFSLTKIVEVAHYNMDRIRLVWSRIWNVLSDFFVSVGLSENLSVAIFVMDSLRQLAMKFLEREELVNYNFQNEFLRPFIVVMQRSGSAVIRELIVRCVSQTVLSRVHNVKSGWRSVFMVFTAAAADERKNIVLLAFETMEKIVREHFLYITETETVTFTDCVNCLIAFAGSRFNSDVSLNAIAFLRFCAAKLAEGFTIGGEEDESQSYWLALFAGLSSLASNGTSAVRKTSLEVLFDLLSDHGFLFSPAFFDELFISAVLPVYAPTGSPSTPGGNDSAASLVAVESLVDTYARFFAALRPRLPDVVAVLTGLIRSSSHGLAATGISALLRLLMKLGAQLAELEWSDILRALDAANASVCSGFAKLMADAGEPVAEDLEPEMSDPDDDDDGLQSVAYLVSRTKGHISVQLLITRMLEDLHSSCVLSAPNVCAVMEIYSSVASNARAVRAHMRMLHGKLDRACAVLELSEPPSLHFEIESNQGFLRFLQSPSLSSADPDAVERMTVDTCVDVLCAYLDCEREPPASVDGLVRWVLPPPSGMKEEMDARSSTAALSLRALHAMQPDAYARHAARLFPLVVGLVRIDHGSVEVQLALSHAFEYCIGPILFKSL